MQNNKYIIIVRHGLCKWHSQGRFIGWSKIGLAAQGIVDVKKISEKISKFNPSNIISSDLPRARDTANIIGNSCNSKVKLDKRLREENLGKWTGLLRKEVKTRFPEEYKRWCNGDIFKSYGEREGLDTVAHRAGLVVDEAISNSCGESIVIVTHLNTAISIIANILDIPKDKWTILGDLVPASFSVISQKSYSNWILEKHNIT